MPTPPLTPAQLASLAARLDEREAQLRAEMRAVNEQAAETPTRQPDAPIGDAGEQGEERTREAMRYAAKERDIMELRQIEDARGRMRDGSYGLCVDCGTTIPIARLEVQPYSERCVPCQEKFEAAHPVGVRISAP